MQELRKNTRFDASGKAKITDVPKCQFLVRNLSITGCCLKCVNSPKILKINEKYKVNIMPEFKSHIRKFDLEVECKWMRNDEEINEYGLEIYSSPSGKNFQYYVDYLSYRSGLSGN